MLSPKGPIPPRTGGSFAIFLSLFLYCYLNGNLVCLAPFPRTTFSLAPSFFSSNIHSIRFELSDAFKLD
jgi:hypothetical protein